ncbi:MAG: DUF2314 domain-containing protein [Janthinobacterium lividum]
MKYNYLLIGLTLLLSLPVMAQKQPPTNDAPLAPTAPADRPVSVVATPAEASAALAAFKRHIAPAIKQGQASLPQAKRRFLQGLPDGQVFFVTTCLTDPDGSFEQVFVRVRQWQDKQVSGLIANELGNVKTFQQNQLITFSEAVVFDWTISRPDGTEEGNYIGKLLDADSR